jgi:uncharacterized protein (TIGR02246 family)
MNHHFPLQTVLLVLCLGLGPSYSDAKPAHKTQTPEQQIRVTLESTSDGWNHGDLGKYLAAYTDEATEMTRNGPAGGRDAIEKTMRDFFWKTGRPEQKLRYDHIVVRMLGRDNALVTGQYVLTGASIPDRSGWFTTIWQRTKVGWRMIHDHS